MQEIKFDLHICGMSEKTYTEQIMIYRPIQTATKTFSKEALDQLGITHISDLIEHIKRDDVMSAALGEWGLQAISAETVYIHNQDYLLKLRENKKISDIFDYFRSDTLELLFFIVGGASIHNEKSYRFTVHPDEDVHRYLPHVHVSKDNVEIRYSLETLQPLDPLVNPHKRDNKKSIIPFLQENQKKLLEFWRLYMDGYVPPQITQEGQQFYAES